MILEVIRQMMALIKEQKALAKYKTQLLTMPLNIEALQAIVDNAGDKEIVVEANGFHMIIRPYQPYTPQPSFKTRYEEAHK